MAPSSLFSLSSRASPTSSLGLADRFCRKKVLIAGWLVGVTVPFMIMLATSWGWIVAANVLLGVNQSLAWSMTVIMKIDLVGQRGRGLAVGLNEFAGYLVVGLTALATGYLASVYGLRPEPFYPGRLRRARAPRLRFPRAGHTGAREDGDGGAPAGAEPPDVP